MSEFVPSTPSAAASSASSAVEEITKSLTTLDVKRAERAVTVEGGHLSNDKGCLFSDPYFKDEVKMDPRIIDALTIHMGFTKPSEIQYATIPRMLRGKNIIGQGQPGSGKTIAFTIGMLSKVDATIPQLQALCLTPTRELALQTIEKAIKPLTQGFPLKPKYEIAVKQSLEEKNKGRFPPRGAKSDAQIIVGTPGTVKSWIQSNYINLDYVKVFVLDEADTMVGESEFKQSLSKEALDIRNKLPKMTQFLFFSATFSDEIKAYAEKIIRGKTSQCLLDGKETLIIPQILQVRIRTLNKIETIKDIYNNVTLEKSLIFCKTKDSVREVVNLLKGLHFTVSHLTGDLDPAIRDREFNSFANGDTKVLVATDVLARGVDIPEVSIVINYEPPQDEKDTDGHTTYVHRIGRCSRFGRHGTAITLIGSDSEEAMMYKIEQFYGYSNEKRMTMSADPSDIISLGITIDQHNDSNITQVSLVVQDDVELFK